MLEPMVPRPNQEQAIRQVLKDHSFADYLARKVEVSGTCWIWQGSLSNHGYGGGGFGGVKDHAHRLVYRTLVGPIPKGLHLDHLCRNRGCVNPDHLEPVSAKENLRRGNGWAGTKAKAKKCPQGHAYDTENIYEYRGRRYCRACMKANDSLRTQIRVTCNSCGKSYPKKSVAAHINQVHGGEATWKG